MRNIIDADEYEECSPDTMTPDDNSDLLLGESPTQSAEDLWPEPAQVFRLWQIYLDKVNPLTKIIHVPTLQPYLATATTGSHNVPKNIEALLFAIFLMATIASSDDECTIVLGYPKNQALQRFSSGVRSSLMRMGFLKSYDMTTLQALVIYQVGAPKRGAESCRADRLDLIARSLQPSRGLDFERDCHPHRPEDGPAPRR